MDQVSEYSNYGSNVDETMQNRINTLIEKAPVYKGQDLYQNCRYIKDNLAKYGNWDCVIANPTIQFAAYVSEMSGYWAVVQRGGPYKWTYYIFRTY